MPDNYSLKNTILAAACLTLMIFKNTAYADICTARQVCKHYGYDNQKIAGYITAVKCLLIEKSGRKTCHCTGLHENLSTPKYAKLIMELGGHYPNYIPKLNQRGYNDKRYNMPGLSCPDEDTKEGAGEFQKDGTPAQFPDSSEFNFEY